MSNINGTKEQALVEADAEINRLAWRVQDLATENEQLKARLKAVQDRNDKLTERVFKQDVRLRQTARRLHQVARLATTED